MHPGELVQERYELQELLGQGGMGEVWRARDERLERSVAIKFLAAQFTDDPEFLVRLFSEAQSVAAISHPNVTGVLDFGTGHAGPYLVMEYVSGGTLGDLTGAPMMPERAVEIMQQVASGAGAAHRRGIVHRDIKPGNILIAADGGVKLADFGIASSDLAANLTATGTAIGSPHYISPEQALGARATPRSDVYAMGVVLYQLLTGRLPFDGANPTAIAISHVEQTAQPPSSLVSDLDPDLDALVMRCLDKQPEARFVDGAELAAALEHEGHSSPTAAPAAYAAWYELAPLWRRNALIGAVVALTVIAVVGFATYYLPSRRAAAEPRATNTAPHAPRNPHRGRPDSGGSGSSAPGAAIISPVPGGSPSQRTKVKPTANPRTPASKPTPTPTTHRKPKASPRPTPTPTTSQSATPTPTTQPSPSPTA